MDRVERRSQRIHPVYAKPELLATAPNQVWSWDITKLLGPAKWTYFYLYVILDVYSRYAVGWMVAYRELASLAEQLITETVAKHALVPGQLTIHGVTKDVTASLQLRVSGTTAQIAGTIATNMTDFGISPPNIGFTTVQPAVTIEVSLNLAQGA